MAAQPQQPSQQPSLRLPWMPVARVPTPPHWFHSSNAFPSLPFPSLPFPSLALGTRREERDCVSVPAAANVGSDRFPPTDHHKHCKPSISQR
ncbi:hypothetical protein EYF80_007006 [Liparis tanakae]|uniref:Uncharacterized protein n=1 Tax=Liparis tanakae TaxID=230148 RepID=A0A4Z2IXQ5_9TELE|nr:hypothetical protein EYF80_007006 [Liparis tanakae]